MKIGIQTTAKVGININLNQLIQKIKFVLSDAQTNGDLLYVLNFTDDDIYYRKKKS